ncbi:transposase [Kibdelosporangium phytohabitans]|uniref:transposase n=1 Tax=Kibdelosporangium phytohabitans TaxID=860235 RepID=UPI001CEF3D96|nr:transposase [Kibdelosporangium phytohabitans]
MTDAQWALPEPLLPRPSRSGRPPSWSKRQLIDGIRWRVRSGSPWRDTPTTVWILSRDPWTVPPVAAGRRLAHDPDRASRVGRRGRTSHRGCPCGPHDRASASARRRCPEKGVCSGSRRAGSPTSPMNTHWAVRGPG